MDHTKHAERYSQKIEVSQKKDEIVALVKIGFPYPQIQKRIGLGQMPRSTFFYHASKLGPDAQDPAYRTEKASSDEDRTPTDKHAPPPSPPLEKAGEEKVPEEASKDAAQPQPKSVTPVKVVLDDPDKKVRPRRKGGKITPDLSVKKDEFDTSKWSSELK